MYFYILQLSLSCASNLYSFQEFFFTFLPSMFFHIIRLQFHFFYLINFYVFNSVYFFAVLYGAMFFYGVYIFVIALYTIMTVLLAFVSKLIDADHLTFDLKYKPSIYVNNPNFKSVDAMFINPKTLYRLPSYQRRVDNSTDETIYNYKIMKEYEFPDTFLAPLCTDEQTKKSLNQILRFYTTFINNHIAKPTAPVNFYPFHFYATDYDVPLTEVQERARRRAIRTKRFFQEYRIEEHPEDYHPELFDLNYDDFRTEKIYGGLTNYTSMTQLYSRSSPRMTYRASSPVTLSGNPLAGVEFNTTFINLFDHFWFAFSYFQSLINFELFFFINYFNSNFSGLETFVCYFASNVFFFSICFIFLLSVGVVDTIKIKHKFLVLRSQISVPNIISLTWFFTHVIINGFIEVYKYFRCVFTQYLSVFELTRFKKFKLILPDHLNFQYNDVLKQLPYLKPKLQNHSSHFSKTAYNNQINTYPGFEGWDVLDYMLNPIELNLYYSNHPTNFLVRPELGLYRARPDVYKTLKNQLSVFFINEYSFPYLYVEENFTKISSFVNRIIFVLVTIIFFPFFFIIELFRFIVINVWLQTFRTVNVFLYKSSTTFNFRYYFLKLIRFPRYCVYGVIVNSAKAFYFFYAICVLSYRYLRPPNRYTIQFNNFRNDLYGFVFDKLKYWLFIVYYKFVSLLKFIHIHALYAVMFIRSSPIFRISLWVKFLRHFLRHFIPMTIIFLLSIPFFDLDSAIWGYVEVRFFCLDIWRLLRFAFLDPFCDGIGFRRPRLFLYYSYSSGYLSSIYWVTALIMVTVIYHGCLNPLYRFSFLPIFVRARVTKAKPGDDLSSRLFLWACKFIFGDAVFRKQSTEHIPSKFSYIQPFILDYPFISSTIETYDLGWVTTELDDEVGEETDEETAWESIDFEELRDIDEAFDFATIYVNKPSPILVAYEPDTIDRFILGEFFPDYPKFARWLKEYIRYYIWEFDSAGESFILFGLVYENMIKYDKTGNMQGYLASMVEAGNVEGFGTDDGAGVDDIYRDIARTRFFNEHHAPRENFDPIARSKSGTPRSITRLFGPYGFNISVEKYFKTLPDFTDNQSINVGRAFPLFATNTLFYDFFFFKWRQPEFIFKYPDQVEDLMDMDVVNGVGIKDLRFAGALSIFDIANTVRKPIGSYDSVLPRRELYTHIYNSPAIKLLESKILFKPIRFSYGDFSRYEDILPKVVGSISKYTRRDPLLKFEFYSSQLLRLYFRNLTQLNYVNSFEIYIFGRNAYSQTIINDAPYSWSTSNYQPGYDVILWTTQSFEIFYVSLHELPCRNVFALAQMFGAQKYYHHPTKNAWVISNTKKELRFHKERRKEWREAGIPKDPDRELLRARLGNKRVANTDEFDISKRFSSDFRIDIRDVYNYHYGSQCNHPREWWLVRSHSSDDTLGLSRHLWRMFRRLSGFLYAKHKTKRKNLYKKESYHPHDSVFEGPQWFQAIRRGIRKIIDYLIGF